MALCHLRRRHRAADDGASGGPHHPHDGGAVAEAVTRHQGGAVVTVLVLALDGVAKSFGGLMVIDDVSFQVPEGSRTALIGPNGSGKTTTFNLISGIYEADAGAIRLQ